LIERLICRKFIVALLYHAIFLSLKHSTRDKNRDDVRIAAKIPAAYVQHPNHNVASFFTKVLHFFLNVA